MSGLPSDYSYWGMVRQYGLLEAIKSPILWVAIVFSSLIVGLRLTKVVVVLPGDIRTMVGIAIGVNAALLAIVLAGLAILVSLMDERLLHFLWRNRQLGPLLFLFRTAAYTLGLGIAAGGILYLSLFMSSSEIGLQLTVLALGWLFLFGTSYGLLSTINLVTATAYFGIYKARFINLQTGQAKSAGESEGKETDKAAGRDRL